MTDEPKKRLTKLQREGYTTETKRVQKIRKSIKVLEKQLEDETDPATIDRIMRTISTCLKAIEDYKRDAEQRDAEIKESLYTPYADYPPPSLEDRERFIARIQSLLPPLGDPRNPIHAIVEEAVRRFNDDAPHLEPMVASGSEGSEDGSS